MQPWEIILICFCAIIAVALGMWWKHSLLTQLTKTNEDKKTKGDKMRKKKNAELERQEQMIKELKNKVEYLELKENGAEILWGKYTLVRYAYDGGIKEISIGGDLQAYNKKKETEQYIILQSIWQIDNCKIAKIFYIIDKATGNIYTAQELNEEIEKYNEMLKALNEIEEENDEKGE